VFDGREAYQCREQAYTLFEQVASVLVGVAIVVVLQEEGRRKEEEGRRRSNCGLTGGW